jgi:hypothetical protein
MGVSVLRQEQYRNMVGSKVGNRLLLFLMDTQKENNPCHNKYFWSRCDCGKEARVLAAAISMGKRTHCGCMNEKRFMDLTGQRFGKWTVISRAEDQIVPATGQRNSSRSKRGMTRSLTRWNCRCDCGTEKINYGGNLKKGKSTQCLRCKIKELTIKRKAYYANGGTRAESIHGGSIYRDHGITARYNAVKHSAEKRKKVFDISLDLYRELALSDCFFCGASPSQVSHGKHAIAVNGLDRYDNTIGYCNNNVVPCCTTCNLQKGNKHGDDFLKIIFAVAAYHS